MTTNPHRYALLTVLQLADLAVIALGFTLAVVTELRPEPWVNVLELRIRSATCSSWSASSATAT